MTDLTPEMDGRAAALARQDRPDISTRVAELEADNVALRRALAGSGVSAGRCGGLRDGGPAEARAGRADDAARARSAADEAEARHGRAIAAGRADPVAVEADRDAFRSANAGPAAGRADLREGEARWRALFGRMQEGFAYCEMVYGPDGRAVDYRHLKLNAA